LEVFADELFCVPLPAFLDSGFSDWQNTLLLLFAAKRTKTVKYIILNPDLIFLILPAPVLYVYEGVHCCFLIISITKISFFLFFPKYLWFQLFVPAIIV